ncbi:MAG: RecX family transcriptional regulator [bacterium]|nr:RecX family transcriptional regulator [bacterium]
MTGKRPRPPIDEDSLRDLALHYVGRFATSRAKLVAYLDRKVRERGWGGEQPAEIDALVERLTDLGYINDSSFAALKSAALARRGFGARRVNETLRAAGIAETDRGEADATTHSESWSAADRFAKRKRIGPYAQQMPDPKQRDKMIAAFLRAGHGFAIARLWVDAAPGEPPEPPE